MKYDTTDDGSCIRIFLNGKIVAIVEDYYLDGHVHAAFRQLLEQHEEDIEMLHIYQDKE
jgi:hypothetical protein